MAGPSRIPWLALAPQELILNVTGPMSRLVKRTPLIEPTGPQRRLSREERLERDFMALAGDFERLLDKGIGNQVGLHVYDTAINFDFSLENVLGILLDLPNNAKAGNLQQRLGGEALMMALGAAPVLAPGYMAVPVRDAKVVDNFLAKVDKLLVLLARQRQGGGAFQVEPEYYRINGKDKQLTRSFGVRVGPVRLRLFWARIGDGLYIANQAVVLDDIRAAHRARPAKLDDGPVGHALIRLRPRNWNQALTGFRLAWAENNREACLHNLGPLSSGARAFCAGARSKGPGLSWDRRADEAHRYAERLYGMGFCCPDHGKYLLSKDGKAMTCSVHDSALDPRQPDAPAKDGQLDRLMRDFADLSATLTFAPEGLRTVVVIERR